MFQHVKQHNGPQTFVVDRPAVAELMNLHIVNATFADVLEEFDPDGAMYIGDITTRGLHHLVSEVVDNSIDEAMAGFATHVSVTVNSDGSVTRRVRHNASSAHLPTCF